MNFPIRNCPICQQNLKLNYSGTTSGYICPIMVSYPSLLSSDGDRVLCQSHYSVMYNGTTIQRIILPPYLIITEAGANQTRIYDMSKCGEENPRPPIMELPALDTNDPTKLLKRIQSLIPFS